MNSSESLQPIADEWYQEDIGVIPAIDVQDVFFGQSHDPILHGVNLSIRENGCFGIVGPAGGGKTTLLRLILGLMPANEGSVRLYGHKPSARLRRRLPIGYLPQFSPVPDQIPATVWDYIRLGAYNNSRVFRPIDPENRMYASNIMTALHLDHRLNQPISHLSPGEQQRARIARALVSFPKLLVLDDPFQSMDPQGQEIVVRLLADLRRRIHTTIVIFAQDGKSLTPVCKHIACLNRSILWVSARKRIGDEVWSDPCRIFPSTNGDRARPVEPHDTAQSSNRIRTLPATHTIQFWR